MKYLKNENEFKNQIETGTVLVDFYADWCGPCQLLGKELEKLETRSNEVKILKVDTDKFQNLAREYKILSIPTIMIYKDGKCVNTTTGYLTKEELENLLK